MNLSLSLGDGGASSLTVLWEDGERVLCRGSRADSDGDRTAVLAVLSAAEHPTPGFVDRLAHEYGLKDELDGRSAARPLALVREHGRTMLLLEDPGGEPLGRLVGRPIEIGRFLRFATGISAALRQLHERGLIHKDIKPANVLADFATGRVWLTGFGIASHLPRERQSPEPPELVAGTLAYMAPEQTGRMNRSIDSRSDLYALGVTLYQMLTGSLPFTAADPMEWVHCHIARKPVPPSERLETVPAAVSALILKLLAKTAEERYQTAAGLERDLRRCLAAWEAPGIPQPDTVVTADGMIRAALQSAVGQGFYPGIEAGIITQDPTLYMTPFEFRLDHAQAKPGDLTALMALPWQADFYACGRNWWPSQRPNDTFPAATSTNRAEWSRGINSFLSMVHNFPEPAFITAQRDAQGNVVFVEDQRAPDTAFA
jgi:serine/threonine protein kinase